MKDYLWRKIIWCEISNFRPLVSINTGRMDSAVKLRILDKEL